MLTHPDRTVAGETSGDPYGVALVRCTAETDPCVRCFGAGGDRIAGTGVELVDHIEEVWLGRFDLQPRASAPTTPDPVPAPETHHVRDDLFWQVR